MLKEIRLTSKEKTNKQGNTFLVHKGQMKDGNWIEIKFRRTIKNVPTDEGQCIMKIDSANLDRAHTDFGDVYWVKGEPEGYAPYVKADTAVDDF